MGSFKQVKALAEVFAQAAQQEICPPGSQPVASRSMTTFDTGFAPDPESAADVLAFVLCPSQAFAPTGDPEEWEAIGELMRPVKAEAIRRWSQAAAARKRS